jgi:hypothetical protein
MALVEPETLDRLDALRIVTGNSRARVAEEALKHGGLNRMEKENRERLDRLAAVAARRGQGLPQFTRQYARDHARNTYGTTLEELEMQAGSPVETVPVQ